MIRIMVAEDMRMLRETLVAVLALEDDIDVVASVERGDTLVDTALRTQPDVAVIDIDLPGGDGLVAAAELHQRLPGCRTLVLTGLASPGHLRRALRARAAGFLLKHAPPKDLIDAIRRIAAGERVIDPDVALAALDAADNPLTAREMDVLRIASTGAEPAEIAAQLSLSTGTVRNYLTSAEVRLNARNRVDAIRIASDAGWL
jgi:two-component system, NarL family, response regulator DesR